MMRLRNFFSSFHFILVLAIALSIVILSYLIVRTYRFRFDFSEGKIYSLSSQSLQVLDELKKTPVRVYAFFREESNARMILENLLKEYAYRHGNFHYQFYDPDRMPAQAKKYQIDEYDTIVFETRDRREKTRQITEEAITNALAKLLSRETKRVVFASGYGGPSLDETKDKYGYGILKQKLTNFNYEVKETILLKDGIAKGDDLVVLGGPRTDLLPEEIKVLRDYLKRGGNLLVLIDPYERGEGRNLTNFLSDYGFELKETVIIDKLSKLFGTDYLVPLITDYKPHPITKDFRMACFFLIARSVSGAKKLPQGIEVTELALTGAGSWAETNLEALSEGEAEFDKKRDFPGPLPVAATASIKGKGRVLVIGDSDFATNGFLNFSGNKDFLLNSISWLVGDERAISIRPRERQVTPLYLKETDQEYLFYVPVLGLPISFLLIGGVISFARRRFH